MNTEQLTQASHSAEFMVRHLQQALTHADAVEALVLLPLIEQAARINQQIGALLAAVEAREAGQ